MEMQTIQDNKSLPTSEEGVNQFLTFELNSETYGIDILDIKEIIDRCSITRVPMMPDAIAGVINLRGSVVPVVDLALRFSQQPIPATKRSSIVILEIEHEGVKVEIGVTVDVVNEVLNIKSGDVEVAPSFGAEIRTDFISGMGKVNNSLLMLLNVETILSIDELSLIEEI